MVLSCSHILPSNGGSFQSDRLSMIKLKYIRYYAKVSPRIIDDKTMLKYLVDCSYKITRITVLQFAMDYLHYNCILKQK